jgi:putative heme-binding domain-containing protein
MTVPFFLRRVLAVSVSVFALHAASAEVKGPDVDPALSEFVQGFKGRGALNDDSKPLTPEETLRHFKLAPGLQMEVVAHEPAVAQPLNMHFDERGRLWVVQYLQYPFPAGLKVLKFDEHLRAVFDKVPPPPPNHFKGKDRVTILEDKDQDGKFEAAKDFVSDLNIVRSVVTGRGGIWILNPPYLLFYPDKNRDDVPDAPPQVALSGFGLEDTHSGANSLAWGPDGWLYGAHGSTCTATIKGVHFLGQAIWRYNPATTDFEVFAEGGGNTFSFEFDAEGRAFSGTNYGNTRGMHYPQGSAGIKGWAKHGPLMNPYSFGWFEHMAHKGFEPRFPQTMVVYEGGAIPALERHIVAPMSLQNRVMGASISPDTSTYRTDDLDPLVLTDDRWFRPVDTKVGPDGAIYMADWYDSRLSHVDPRDTWDKEHGRIYRLKATGAAPAKPVDLGALSSKELTQYFSHPNKYFRQTALRLLYDRRDEALVPALLEMVRKETGQKALEAFWALNASGGFTDALALETLDHPHPMVRYWTVRLLGDRYPPARYSSSTVKPAPLPEKLHERLSKLATAEAQAQVRGQLASAAKRLPGTDALPIIRELMYRAEDTKDKHNPLLIWWALESKAISDRAAILALLKETSLWQSPLFSEHIASRLAQRYTAERTPENFETAAQLLTLAPSPQATDTLIKGMDAGLQGDRVESVPASLQKQIATVWESRPHTPTLISVALRLGHAAATPDALQLVGRKETSAADRKALLALLSDRGIKEAIPTMLTLLQAETKDSGRIDLINALARFNTPDVAQAMLELLPKSSGPVRSTIVTSLARRADWALALLQKVEQGEVKKEALTPGDLFAIQNLGDAAAHKLVQKLWGNLRPSSQAKEQRITQVRKLVGPGRGSADKGHELFRARCAICHTFKGEGGKIGPDLTGYERDNLDFMIPAIVDPSLGIREEYTAFSITTKGGQALIGFITETDPKAVTIMDLAANKTRLSREEITSQAALPTSMMPEGLLDGMKDEEVRDLFAYLMKK